MNEQIVYIVGAMVLVYAVFFAYMYLKKKRRNDLLSNTNFKKELTNAAFHKTAYLNSNLSFVSKQMEGKSIDAFNFANVNYTTKELFKDGVKDSLKGIATLGTVRFQTVQTPKYLILSGSDLHLLDTDTDGEISNHLVFNSTRLEKSKITEIPLEGKIKAFAKQKGELTKAYRISLSTDDDPIDLILFSALTFTYASTAGSAFSLNSTKDLQEIIIGNDFLIKLGERFPNLRVSAPILSYA